MKGYFGPSDCQLAAFSELVLHTLSPVVAAAAQGDPFLANLDTDPPIERLAVETQAERLARAQEKQLSVVSVNAVLGENISRRLA